MTYNEFFEDVRLGVVKQAYLFTGTEEFVKREALEKLREKLLPAGLETLNENVLEGVNADSIIEAAETLPMMCDRRLVTVRDWAPLMGRQAAGEEDEMNRIISWLDKPCETCTLVFYMRGEAAKAKKLVKALTAKNLTVEFSPLTDPDLRKWVNKRLKPAGKKMSPQAVQQLVFTAGRDLTRLDGELSKLIAFTDSRSEIDESDIEQIVSPSLEFGAFDMLNKLFDGDVPGAFRTLDLMLERGANRVGIMASLSGQLRGMTFLRIASENRERPDEVTKAFDLNPYAAKIMDQKAKRFAAGDLDDLYRLSVDLNFDIKNGRVRDAEALDMLFLKISQKVRRNRATGGRASASNYRT